MSTSVSTPRETDVLAPRIASLERDAQALAQALADSRRRRLWLMLAVVALVAAICYAFYNLAMQFQSKENMEKLKVEAQKEMDQRSEFFSQEVQKLMKNSAPVLQTALTDQINADLPAFLQATEAERDQLVENLQAKLKTLLHERHEKLLAQHQEMLAAEFPAVRDEKLRVAMMQNLLLAVDRLVEKYYVQQMKSGLLGLYEKWDAFPPAAPAGKDDVPLSEQLVGNLMELLSHKVADAPSGPIEVASP